MFGTAQVSGVEMTKLPTPPPIPLTTISPRHQQALSRDRTALHASEGQVLPRPLQISSDTHACALGGHKMSRLSPLEHMGGHHSPNYNNPQYLKGTPLALALPPSFHSLISPSYFSSPSTSCSITTVPHPKQNHPIYYPSPEERGDLTANMPEDANGIPVHPIAPRLSNGPKTPHIGPNILAYQAAHGETIGHESDHWWAKVRAFAAPFPSRSPFLRRYLTVTSIKTIPILSDRIISR